MNTEVTPLTSLPPRRARTGDIASARLASVVTMWREVVDGALVSGED
jgi:hypothetical protein